MIKILFLAANPLNTQMLRLDEEMRAIDLALRQGEFCNRVDLRSHWAVRASDLQELFLRYEPDIVHFSGHGSTASEIILQDDRGQAAAVPADALTGLFAIFKDRIRCVFLNACYSEDQAGAIGVYIDTVIGVWDKVADDAARAFSAAFYRGIAYGRDVLTAFNLGLSQLELSGSMDARKPQLHGKSDPASVKFDINAGGEEAAVEKPATDETPWWKQIPETAPKSATGKTTGDVIIATVGAGAKNIAVGKNIRQVITEVLGHPQPDDKMVVQSQLAGVKAALDALKGSANATLLQMADFQLKLLGGELTKTEEGETPSASTIMQVGDWLLDNLPQMKQALTGLFATPAVGRVIGKAGEAAVEWVKRHLGT